MACVVHISYLCNISFASSRKLLNGLLVRVSEKKDMSLYAERICRLSLSPRVSKLNPLEQSLSKQVESVDSEGEVLGGSVLLFMAAAHSLGKLRLFTCLRGSTGGAPVTTVVFPPV